MDKNSALRRSLCISLAFLAALLLPTVIVGGYYYQTENANLTNTVFSQRQTVASLSASVIKLKLDRLVELAQLYASQRSIKNGVGAGNWSQAVSAATELSNQVDFYDEFIDRVIFISTKGKIEGAFPELYGGVGQDSAIYPELKEHLLEKGEASYVSNVYVRKSTPRINIISITVPVTNGSAVAGFFSLQIPINAFSDYGKDTNVGSDGFAYYVDRLGQIVTHPKYSSEGRIVDFSKVVAVQQAIQGRSGIGIESDPIEHRDLVVAYEPIRTYHWGVIAQEPASEAFASRNDILDQIYYGISLLCALELFAALLMFILQDRRESH